ncbi:hypothetical protein Micbo1qcDRAFT_180708 [Microdochium bolleyi]|uniref:Uncharacterized protein n=1 Tax=Microdochium bolleyi TaxID=196109 RepID=A0A136ILP0_9PEZI|nr:hypothetical protein Micbo1qcDRAFT_180708 [Microdochium bolleyi]
MIMTNESSFGISRRDACVHSTRIVHARRRWALVEQYQSRRNDKGPVRFSQSLTAQTPRPVTSITVYRHDLFAAFARPLAHIEHVLLDHLGRTAEQNVHQHCRVAMFRDMVEMSVTRSDALDDLLLAAHRQLVMSKRRERRRLQLSESATTRQRLPEEFKKGVKMNEDREGLRLRLKCMWSLREAMAEDLLASGNRSKGLAQHSSPTSPRLAATKNRNLKRNSVLGTSDGLWIRAGGGECLSRTIYAWPLDKSRGVFVNRLVDQDRKSNRSRPITIRPWG